MERSRLATPSPSVSEPAHEFTWDNLCHLLASRAVLNDIPMATVAQLFHADNGSEPIHHRVTTPPDAARCLKARSDLQAVGCPRPLSHYLA